VQPVHQRDVLLPGVVPGQVEVLAHVQDGDPGALQVGRVEDLHVDIGAAADGEVVAGVQLPPEAGRGAQDDRLGDPEAAGRLVGALGAALAGLAEAQELAQDGRRVHADAVVLPGQRAGGLVPGDLEAPLPLAGLA